MILTIFIFKTQQSVEDDHAILFLQYIKGF